MPPDLEVMTKRHQYRPNGSKKQVQIPFQLHDNSTTYPKANNYTGYRK